ncbi:uncharacterized protein TRIADDRAFT_30950, partial [Trichoplax adhaerens]
FSSKKMAIRVEKKLLGRMATRGLAKMFIDDSVGSLLDNIYTMAKLEMKEKKKAEKLVKNILKIIVKIGILYRYEQLNEEELEIGHQLQDKFHQLILTIISFREISFTFDKRYLIRMLNECKQLIDSLINRHLTDKSHKRVKNVFEFYSNEEFIERAFDRNDKFNVIMDEIVDKLNHLVESGQL